MLTIQEFCDKHSACEKGRIWAMENCRDMQEVWDTIKSDWLVWIALRTLELLELKKFALFCATQVKHLMKDERSIKSLEVAKKYLDGNASVDELEKACSKATYALDYNICISSSLASYSAWAATLASYDYSFTRSFARMASDYSVDSYDSDCVKEDIMKKQSDWLRENTNPNFH